MRTKGYAFALATVMALATVLIAAPAFAASITVTVSTDKATYNPGQSIKVTAVARYSDGKPVTSTKKRTVTLYKPDGDKAIEGVTMASVGSGVYTYSYVLATGAPLGTWRARCSFEDSDEVKASAEKTFSVVAATVTPPPTPTPTPNPTVTPPPASGTHGSLTWSGYPSNCRSCHASQFSAVHGSLHYQWQGLAPDNTNKTGTLQGKMTNAMNAYCISIQGNWGTCGKCHAGRGAQPVWTSTPTAAQLDNIDCLVCHNEAYGLARVRRTDGSMGPALGTAQVTLDSFVRAISKPTRANCLKCHAYAGGGDAVKRGDISWVQTNTADGNLDVHMATTRGNLKCQACHKFVNHKVTGKGSDLEATDYASEIKCATSSCHPTRVNGGHSTSAVNSHVAHVACQTCHIPAYGKVATEVSRDWRTPVVNGAGWKPTETKASNLTPTYKWWNRKTANYLKGDSAVYDAATGTYHMEVLQGGVAGDATNKIYPFKYKVAYQPLRTTGKVLVALDTNEYLNVSGSYANAVMKGLLGMGFASTDAYTTVKTDTYQLLNHTVPDAQSTGGVLRCADCHGSTVRMDLKGKMGYALKGPQSTVCVQCHENESWEGYVKGHDKHVRDKKYDCSWCHGFSRPERGLSRP